jgi:beta-N-acetylhexosaminidase
MEAGADILLMPRNVTEAINTVEAAVSSGRLTQSRIDASVRRVLRAKAQAGLRTGRLVDLEAVDSIVNVPARSSVAREVAEKSITLARDSLSLVPLALSSKVLAITYADGGDLVAGRVFNQELRSAGFDVSTANVDSRTTEAELARLRARADSADVVIAAAYVFPRDGRGVISAEGGFPSFVERLSVAGRKVIAISFGSPYLVSAFSRRHLHRYIYGPVKCMRIAYNPKTLLDLLNILHIHNSEFLFLYALKRPAKISGSTDKVTILITNT